jgi:hypothetical protein
MCASCARHSLIKFKGETAMPRVFDATLIDRVVFVDAFWIKEIISCPKLS